MQELRPDVCARVAMRWSLLFAALGVLAAYLLLVLLGAQALAIGTAPEYLSGLAVGLATLCLSAGLFGRLAGRIVYRSGNNVLVNLFIGVGLALGCLILTTIAGTLVGVLMVVSKQPTFARSNPLKDVAGLSLLILFYGTVPAALLGLGYGALVKVTLDRKLKRKPAPIDQLSGDPS
jgi:hypothetical protein